MRSSAAPATWWRATRTAAPCANRGSHERSPLSSAPAAVAPGRAVRAGGRGGGGHPPAGDGLLGGARGDGAAGGERVGVPAGFLGQLLGPCAADLRAHGRPGRAHRAALLPGGGPVLRCQRAALCAGAALAALALPGESVAGAA